MEKVVLHRAGRDDLLKSVESLLLPLGGMDKFVKPGARVLVKPNVGGILGPETGKVTDPEVVMAVVRAALNAGASKVWVAESSIVGYDTEKAFEAAGYGIFRGMEKVSLIDLKKENVRLTDVPEGRSMKAFHIFERAFLADVFINVPRLKTIVSSGMSVGMKNLKGLIRDDNKKQCHYTNLHEAIVDINRCIKPDLTIVDGLVGCSLFEPVEHGILLAGEDIVATDTISALCMGIDPKTVKYLSIAAEAGLGVIDTDKIQVLGEKPEDVRIEYGRAKDDVSAFHSLNPKIAVSAGGACSGCVAVLEQVLKIGNDEGWLKPWEGKLRLVVGPVKELPEDGLTTLYLGNCAAPAAGQNKIKGCPYLTMDVRERLKNVIPT